MSSISYSPPPSQIRKDVSWKPLPQGVLKINFDGASKSNPDPTRYRCAVHNHDGILHKVLSGSLGICDSTMAETKSLFKGLKELKKMGISGCIIEGDSEVVISWDQGKDCNSWHL